MQTQSDTLTKFYRAYLAWAEAAPASNKYNPARMAWHGLKSERLTNWMVSND